MKASFLDMQENRNWNKALGSIQPYYSVEFSLQGVNYLHQLKIWNLAKSSMSVLVRKDSEIIGFLKVGDIIKMKDYRTDMFLPAELLDTEIRNITKEDEGRYKGHYIINLAILTSQTDQNLN